MKRTETKYTCDLCLFDVPKERVVEFAVNNGADYSGAPSCSFRDVQICKECLKTANNAAELKGGA